MKYIPILLLVMLLVMLLQAGCGRVEPALPLSETQMVDILVDVHLAEGAVQELPIAERDSSLNRLYDRIMADHEVDRADFDAAMAVLRKEPEMINRVYTAVLDSLNVHSATTQVDGLR